jgi:hypothetical protein
VGAASCATIGCYPRRANARAFARRGYFQRKMAWLFPAENAENTRHSVRNEVEGWPVILKPAAGKVLRGGGMVEWCAHRWRHPQRRRWPAEPGDSASSASLQAAGRRTASPPPASSPPASSPRRQLYGLAEPGGPTVGVCFFGQSKDRRFGAASHLRCRCTTSPTARWRTEPATRRREVAQLGMRARRCLSCAHGGV